MSPQTFYRGPDFPGNFFGVFQMSRFPLMAVGAAVALALSASAASATVINLGTIGSVETLTGDVPYSADETAIFSFTVAPYFAYTFKGYASLDGVSFAFPFGGSGGAGPATVTFGPVPDTGTLSYTLTSSAVPEPASWLLMIVGAGVMGAGLRRRGSAVTASAATA